MSLADVEPITEALLYEGYLLYPYRHTSIKNRQRFTLGVLPPLLNGQIDDAVMSAECLVKAPHEAEVEMHLRFLHLPERRGEGGDWAPPLDEAEQRDVHFDRTTLDRLERAPCTTLFTIPATTRSTRRADGECVVRHHEALTGGVSLRAESCGGDLFLLHADIVNASEGGGQHLEYTEELMRSFVSTHLVLQVEQGEFVSLLDPPAEASDAASRCHNDALWPVLIGRPGTHDTVLASPIVLYDYPAIVAAGDVR